MFYPFIIVRHDILTTELTPFPILSSLKPTHALADMLVDFVDIED